MIDKIMFAIPVKILGRTAHGILLYTPDTDENVTRVTGIDEKGHAFNKSDEFMEIPNCDLIQLQKVIKKILKGEYDKPDVDNDDLSTEEIGIFTPL